MILHLCMHYLMYISQTEVCSKLPHATVKHPHIRASVRILVAERHGLRGTCTLNRVKIMSHSLTWEFRLESLSNPLIQILLGRSSLSFDRRKTSYAVPLVRKPLSLACGRAISMLRADLQASHRCENQFSNNGESCRRMKQLQRKYLFTIHLSPASMSLIHQLTTVANHTINGSRDRSRAAPNSCL